MSDAAQYTENLMKYAGTPDGIPKTQLDKFWGYINKQLAFANWDERDILVMEENLKQQELREMMNMTEDELADLDDTNPGWDQVFLISKGLMTLGKNGFLVKQSRTHSAEYKMDNGSREKGNKVVDFFTPKKQEGETQR